MYKVVRSSVWKGDWRVRSLWGSDGRCILTYVWWSYSFCFLFYLSCSSVLSFTIWDGAGRRYWKSQNHLYMSITDRMMCARVSEASFRWLPYIQYEYISVGRGDIKSEALHVHQHHTDDVLYNIYNTIYSAAYFLLSTNTKKLHPSTHTQPNTINAITTKTGYYKILWHEPVSMLLLCLMSDITPQHLRLT